LLGYSSSTGLEGAWQGSVFEKVVRGHIKPTLGRLKLKKLTPAHLASFYQDRLTVGFATASVNKLHATLRKAVAYQKRKQEEVGHPVLGQQVPLGLVPYVQARLLARHLRGDTELYAPFTPK